MACLAYKYPVFSGSTWKAGLLWLLLGQTGNAQTRQVPPVTHAVICWQEDRKVRWSDFQAPRNLTSDGSIGAHTSASIAVLGREDDQGRPSYTVECFFIKKESWVRDSCASGNKALLAHEQLHFDIAELFARKIRHKIAQCIRTGCDAWGPEMGAEIECLLQERDEFDAAFDQDARLESAAGAFDEEMWAAKPLPHKWQSLVRRELAALTPYQSSATTCGQKH